MIRVAIVLFVLGLAGLLFFMYGRSQGTSCAGQKPAVVYLTKAVAAGQPIPLEALEEKTVDSYKAIPEDAATSVAMVAGQTAKRDLTANSALNVHDFEHNAKQVPVIAEDKAVAAVTDASFSTEVLQSDKTVMVDFWAPWCGPCRMMAPVVHDVAVKRDGKLKVVKMNVDDNPHMAERYGIRGIPSLLVFKHGKVVDQNVGVLSVNRTLELVDKHI